MRHRSYSSVMSLIAVTAAMVLGALVSCRRIELQEPHSGVYVKFDITVEPEVIGQNEPGYPFPEIVKGRMPQSLRVCFYDHVSHELVAEDFLGPEGGFVSIAAGVYDVMAYSLGTEVTRVTGTESRAGGYAFSGSAGYSLNLTRGDSDGTAEMHSFTVIHEPDHLYVGRQADVDIPVVSAENRILVIGLQPKTILESYTFRVAQVVGAERIQSATCFVTGQASQRYLWDNRYTNTPCAITFSAPVDVESGTVTTAFNTFGRFPGSTSRVFVNLMVNDKSGGKYQWIFDVTEQFDNPDNEEHDIFISEPIVVPEKEQGGFTPTVGDWNAEIIHVPL